MRTLYHLWLDPPSRKIRIILGEKDLAFDMRVEKIWERRESFLRLNPAGEVPVLQEDGGIVLADGWVIAEYLEEAYPDPPLLPEDLIERAETRRLAQWFDVKFAREVTANLLDEKVMKSFLGQGQPDAIKIRAGVHNLGFHLDYIAWLCDRREWLAGAAFSLADAAAAAHVSAIDYLGDVPWDRHAGAKDWYGRVKARPSMQPLLQDFIAGRPPPGHYAELDF